jgi:hypothetical protein
LKRFLGTFFENLLTFDDRPQRTRKEGFADVALDVAVSKYSETDRLLKMGDF